MLITLPLAFLAPYKSYVIQWLIDAESAAEIPQMCIRDSARTAYSLRELKTREDWNEWQANVLGAAILMPQREIDLAVAYYASCLLYTSRCV